MNNLQQLLQTVNKIDSETAKNIALTFLIFFVVIVAQLVIHEVVLVVDSIPVFNSLMQIVGIFAVGKFVKNNLLTTEQRSELIQNIKSQYQTVVGQ